jgi:preprotein translocase, SecE subunit, bacterial
MKWFSIEEIKKEIKRIRWPNKEEMTKDTTTTMIFMVAFGAFFVVCDFIVALLMNVLKIGG